jgi:hypothetical protein
MNLYVLSAITIFVLFIPVSFVGADESESTVIEFEEEILSYGIHPDDDGRIYLFVQVVQRDSNGNLIAFLQSDKMTTKNPNTINYYVDTREMEIDVPIYDFDGQLVQAYGEKFTTTQSTHDITASTMLIIEINDEENPNEPRRQLAARFAHDGLVMAPGDIVETHWYVARLLN